MASEQHRKHQEIDLDPPDSAGRGRDYTLERPTYCLVTVWARIVIHSLGTDPPPPFERAESLG